MRRPALVALVVLAALTAATAAHADEVEIAAPAPPAPAAPALPALPAPATAAPALPAPPTAAARVDPQAASTAPQPALSFGSCAETPRGCTAESQATSGGWYGYQTLISDSVALTLAFASAKLGGWAGAASFGTYLLGAPIVHAVNGRPAMLAASLGTRLLSPVLGAASGFAIGGVVDGCGGGGDYVCGGPIGGAVIGTLSGLAAAVVLDAAVYSRVHPEAPPPSRQGWDGKPTLAPTVAASATGGTVGLGGVF